MEIASRIGYSRVGYNQGLGVSNQRNRNDVSFGDSYIGTWRRILKNAKKAAEDKQLRSEAAAAFNSNQEKRKTNNLNRFFKICITGVFATIVCLIPRALKVRYINNNRLKIWLKEHPL